MSILFNLTFESGILSGTDDSFDSAVTDGGDLSVASAAAMGYGNYGLQCVINDLAAMYGQKNQTAPASNEIRFRRYVDPNALTMAAGDIFINLLLHSTGPTTVIFRSGLRKILAGYQIRAEGYRDAGSISIHNESVTDAPHYVEVHVERAATNVSADGRIRFWVDKVLVKTWNNVDNFDIFSNMDYFRVGAVQGIDAGTSGTFYLDEIRANDDGGEIGPSLYPTSFAVLIDGVDQTSKLIHESVTVTQSNDGLNSTCSFDLVV